MDKSQLTEEQQRQIKAQRERMGILIAVVAFIFIAVILFFYLQNKNILPENTQEPTPVLTPIASENIIVTAPVINERVSDTFTVSGKARIYDNVLSIRVKHTLNGKVFLTDSIYTNAKDGSQFGDFSYTATIQGDSSLRSGDNLVLEVFEFSPKTGNETDTVSIPLKFTPLIE